jgi:hypothetical protein
MGKEQIIQWAREVGFDVLLPAEHLFGRGGVYTSNDDEISEQLEAFAKKVRDDYSNKHAQLWLKRIDEAVKAEREALLDLVDEYAKNNTDLKAAIRARK